MNGDFKEITINLENEMFTFYHGFPGGEPIGIINKNDVFCLIEHSELLELSGNEYDIKSEYFIEFTKIFKWYSIVTKNSTDYADTFWYWIGETKEC